jgi:hypothetical protein
MMKACCEAFEKVTTGHDPQVVQDQKTGKWDVLGCCGGGCYVLTSLRFCPFCAAPLPGKPE